MYIFDSTRDSRWDSIIPVRGITNIRWSISDYLCALINSIREISFLGVSRYIIGYLSWKIESDRFCWIRSPIVTEREEREEHLIDTSLWIQSWKIQFSYFHAFVILLIVKKIHQRWQASTRIYTKACMYIYTLNKTHHYNIIANGREQIYSTINQITRIIDHWSKIYPE